jgi:hypothetical protein
MRCYPSTGTIDPGPEEDYEPNLEGPGAVTREESLRVRSLEHLSGRQPDHAGEAAHFKRIVIAPEGAGVADEASRRSRYVCSCGCGMEINPVLLRYPRCSPLATSDRPSRPEPGLLPARRWARELVDSEGLGYVCASALQSCLATLLAEINRLSSRWSRGPAPERAAQQESAQPPATQAEPPSGPGRARRANDLGFDELVGQLLSAEDEAIDLMLAGREGPTANLLKCFGHLNLDGPEQRPVARAYAALALALADLRAKPDELQSVCSALLRLLDSRNQVLKLVGEIANDEGRS